MAALAGGLLEFSPGEAKTILHLNAKDLARMSYDAHESSSLFDLLQNADPRQIVQLAIRLLHAHHEHEAERLSFLLRGFNDAYLDSLAEHWIKLKAESLSIESALFRLIKKLDENAGPF